MDMNRINTVCCWMRNLSNQPNILNMPVSTADVTNIREELLIIAKDIEHRLFYLNGHPLKRENDLQIMYRLVWYATDFDVNREVNNGRGPVDFKISKGSKDATLVEFKLASNSKLKKNLENQVEVYKKANGTDRAIKVILFFSDAELEKVTRILNELGIAGCPDIVLIDARDNKLSASNV